jgi:hypothetical protein
VEHAASPRSTFDIPCSTSSFGDDVDALITLGRMLGFSLAAGINLYATVAILGFASHFGWVSLPPQFRVFDNPYIIGVALLMYVVEFVADKVPWIDSIWDVVHTAIRPLGGALIAIAAIGHASPEVQVLAALLGGTVAASSHFTKAGTRAIVNVSPEPFSNWFLSLGEDGLVFALGYLALRHPLIALAVAIVLIVLFAALARVTLRGIRRLFSTGSAKRPPQPIAKSR